MYINGRRHHWNTHTALLALLVATSVLQLKFASFNSTVIHKLLAYSICLFLTFVSNSQACVVKLSAMLPPSKKKYNPKFVMLFIKQ
jgi:hypothetical protein